MTDEGWDWRSDAACVEYPVEFFFPAVGGSPKDAKQVCGGCPVTTECLELGMGMVDGVYGGTTPIERRRMRRGAA